MSQILKRRFWLSPSSAFVLLVTLGGVYFGLRLVNRHRDPGPAVSVKEVAPAGPALVGQHVIVRGQGTGAGFGATLFLLDHWRRLLSSGGPQNRHQLPLIAVYPLLQFL